MMELSSRDLEEIRDLHDRWIAKELEGDALGVLKLCTDDVQWLVPNAGPVTGKVAARELLAEPGVEIQSIQTDDTRDPFVRVSSPVPRPADTSGRPQPRTEAFGPYNPRIEWP